MNRASDSPSRSEPSHAEQRSIIELIKELRDEATSFVENEVRLVRTELEEKAHETAHGVMSMASGAAVLWAGLVVLLIAASIGLHAGLVAMGLEAETSVWLAPLIVGTVTVLIGWVMVAVGRSKMKPKNLRPTHTERSLRETHDWAERKVTQ